MSIRTEYEDENYVYRKPISPDIIIGLVCFVDVLIVLASGYFATRRIFDGSDSLSFHHLLPNHLVLVAATSVLSGLMFKAFGCYRIDRIFSSRPKLALLMVAWTTVAIALVIIGNSVTRSGDFPGAWVLLWFTSGMVLFLIHRSVVSLGIGEISVSRLFAQRSLIVGAGEVGARLAAHLTLRPDPMVQVLGFIDDRQSRVPPTVSGIPVLGGTGKLVELVRAGQVDQVILALPWSAEARIRGLLETLDALPINVRLAPDLVGYDLSHRPASTIAGLSFIDAVSRPLSGWASLLKLAEDKVLGAILLVVALPVMAAIALVIKLDSPGPVLFRQTRLGFNDQPFGMLKFRSMHHDMADPDGSVQATRDDCRVTRVGRVLRRFSLDELPQIFNVLTGEMSVVGPRPHPLGMVAAGRRLHETVRKYAARHRVKPGITGWAQVNGWRGETDTLEKIEKRVEFDIYYIENWSLWLDAWVLLKTAFVAFRDPNAY